MGSSTADLYSIKSAQCIHGKIKMRIQQDFLFTAIWPSYFEDRKTMWEELNGIVANQHEPIIMMTSM